MITLRPFSAPDLDRLYAIASANAAETYDDPSLMGSLYSAPYAVLAPEAVFVAEDADGVGGYIVGTHDTRGFAARLEHDWWPALRCRYPEPLGDPTLWTPDQKRHHAFHVPRRVPEAVTRPYPAHVHLQLLPRLQGRGIGPALLKLWRRQMSPFPQPGLHVGVNVANHNAMGFWRAQGFRRLDVVDAVTTVWFGFDRPG